MQNGTILTVFAAGSLILFIMPFKIKRDAKKQADIFLCRYAAKERFIMKLKKLVTLSILAAMTALLTLVYHIPIMQTEGYIHLGDSVIYLTAFLFGGPSAALVGAVGGGIADLLVAPVYCIPTIIVKSLMALAAGFVFTKIKKWPVNYVLSFLCGSIIMVSGYYIAECIMLGSFTSPAAAIPFNFIQAAASVPIPCILVPILRKLLRKNIL